MTGRTVCPEHNRWTRIEDAAGGIVAERYCPECPPERAPRIRHNFGGHYFPLDVQRALDGQEGESYVRECAERARRDPDSARNRSSVRVVTRAPASRQAAGGVSDTRRRELVALRELDIYERRREKAAQR